MSLRALSKKGGSIDVMNDVVRVCWTVSCRVEYFRKLKKCSVWVVFVELRDVLKINWAEGIDLNASFLVDDTRRVA